MGRYIDPRTDFGFKRLFGSEDSKDILKQFLFDILELPDPIAELTFMSPEQQPALPQERRGIYDVYCVDIMGRRSIVEMQRELFNNIREQALYYSTFAITRQAQRGLEWEFALLPVYCIVVLDFAMDEEKAFLRRVQLMETTQKTVFYDKLTFVYIELSKFQAPERDLTPAEKWIYLSASRPSSRRWPIWTTPCSKFFREGKERMRTTISPPVAGIAPRRWGRGYMFERRLAALFFVLPSLFFLAVFVVYPIFSAFYFSLHRYNLLEPPIWDGLGRYRLLLEDTRFFKALGNTFLFALMTVPVGTVISLLLAVLINQSLRGIYFFRTAYYLPVVTSFVAVSFIWLWIYEPQFGVLNQLLAAVGMPTFAWLRDPNTALLSIAILSVWKNAGYNMIIFLAGLQGVPRYLYEAAEIDGANAVQRFWHITLPMLSPTTFFVFVVYFIGALQMFTQSWILTQGGPLDSTLTVVYLIYQNGFEFLKMGSAAAMSVVLFVFIALVTYINTRIIRYEAHFN